jgi:tetratricopeptide (TPR) repeat protein
MNKVYATFCERFGLNAYVSGDYKKAEKWFQKLEVSEPTSIRVLRNLGVILLAQGRPKEAERYLTKEEKLYGPSFYRHAALADLAYAIGNRKEAAKRYISALNDSECAEGGKAVHMSELMERRRLICEDEKSFSATRKAMDLFIEAEKLRESGAFKDSIETFLKSFSLDETNWPALNNAASIYMNSLKQPAEAEPLFERAFEISHSVQVARNLDLCRQAIARRMKGSIKQNA